MEKLWEIAEVFDDNEFADYLKDAEYKNILHRHY